MPFRHFIAPALSLLLLTAAPRACLARHILENVPAEAMGLLVVKNLAGADAKIDKLLSTLQLELPRPLAFLQAVTGVREGLNPQGDLMLAALPSANPADQTPHFAVWLPVTDYAQLVGSLGGAPAEPIVAVTVAGEDVLVANADGWALVMDTNQRDRMERWLSRHSRPPADLAAWQSWIDDNDISAVVLPKGVRALVGWASTAPPGMQIHPQQGSHHNPFDFGHAPDAEDPFAAAQQPASAIGFDARHWLLARRWTTAAPQLTHSILRAKLLGWAARLDDDGNLHSSLRVRGFQDRPGFASGRENALQAQKAPLPPALYEGGPFVIHAAGNPSPLLVSSAVRIYLQTVVEELKSEANMQLRDATVRQFHEAADRAAAGVRSIHVLTQPGRKEEGIYTNDFLVVRADSARTFAEDSQDLMRLWNSMNRDAEADTRLVFDVEEKTFGNRTATEYSLDIAAADGAPALPEIRQAMEKLFGPGGKLHLWIVPIDDENVLLASATADQVTGALHVLDRQQAIDWSAAELSAVNPLLPSGADWRLFFSPHHYNTWQRRQMDAITGPVLGGPLVREFPAAPPIGIGGLLRDDELRIEAAVPAATLQSAGAYLNN